MRHIGLIAKILMIISLSFGVTLAGDRYTTHIINDSKAEYNRGFDKGKRDGKKEGKIDGYEDGYIGAYKKSYRDTFTREHKYSDRRNKRVFKKIIIWRVML